jgi:hypothetical protein
VEGSKGCHRPPKFLHLVREATSVREEDKKESREYMVALLRVLLRLSASRERFPAMLTMRYS